MSINVHVTGNPISIKRGKLISTDPNYAKNEFDKRRLMRLEQVRQQSKEIAEDVRNKVQKEKKKQMRQIEKEGKHKLKNWQNRKLLELQTQYENALKDIGIGHKEAEGLRDESEDMSAQREIYQQISDDRGKVAATKLQMEKNEEVAKKKLPHERKKLVREIEDARSAMVANLSKIKTRCGEPCVKKKKHKASADINITISDSDSDQTSNTTTPSLVEEDEASQREQSTSNCDCTDDSEFTKSQPFIDVENDSALNRRNYPKTCHIPPLHGLSTLHENEFSDSVGKKVSDKAGNHKLSNRRPSPKRPEQSGPPCDTRISDRIRRRDKASQLDYCMKVAETHPVSYIESNTKIRDAINSRMLKQPCSKLNSEISDVACSCKPINLEIDERLSVSPDLEFVCTENQKSCHPLCGKLKGGRENQSNQIVTGESGSSVAKNSPKFQDIPSKPSVKLKYLASHDDKMTQVSKTDVNRDSNRGSKMIEGSKISDTNKVQYYDHPNRFSHMKNSSSFVEKIPTESLEVIPDTTAEAEWLEKIKQRDKEAQLRGKQALNKEKVRRDYEEIMKKLPLLQKKERINEISNDKPEYHMSEERLKEREKIKQNNLDNAFNKMFPDLKPAVVTLPRKPLSNEKLEASDEASVRSLNVGKWDVDFEEPRMFTAQEVQEIVKAFTGYDMKDRRAKLKELLKSLKLQKEELIKEIRALPKDESVDELISDLISVSDSDERPSKHRKKSRGDRKRSRDGKHNDSSADSSKDYSEKDENRKSRYSGRSPRKKAKMKSKRKVMVLQNISTQTTPKPKKDEAPASGTSAEKTCSKIHVPCDCNKENVQQPSEELCQILINLNDVDNPDIVVKQGHSKRVDSKPVSVQTEDVAKIPKKSSPGRSEKAKSKPIPSSDSKSKSTTWKEQLSKNSMSTTSTSYMSPPDLQKSKNSQKSSLYNLRKKPQQKELSSAFSYYQSQDSLRENPKLLAHIKKLLSRDRGSVEELSVSTSNVQTPSQSIIEMESNNPNANNIFDMLKAFHSKIGNVAEGLSYSPDFSPVPFNTSVSMTDSDVPQKDDSSSKTASRGKGSSNSTKSKDSVLAQYADVTDSCSKRIQTLANMIQQLRHEKIQLLHVPHDTSALKSVSPILSDKDFSTAYMDLPGSKESSKNSANSLDEDEIYKKLVEIDLSLANKLKQFTIGEEGGEAVERKDANMESSGSISQSSISQELQKRLNQLNQPESAKPQPDLACTSKSPDITNQPFVPFLSDIPKLPKFEAQPNQFQPNHKRPPPSKGLTVARKFNGNISLTPHELSTIVEADSQLSTKISSNLPSPNTSKTSMLSLKDIELIVIPERNEIPDSRSGSTENEPELVPQITVTAQRKSNENTVHSNRCSPKPKDKSSTSESAESSSKISSSNLSGNKSCDNSSCVKKSLNAKSTSSSGDDIETIEAMLRSIGMEWAIPTLHKTQEALALTSSSSSLDGSAKRKVVGNESSGSEVSLKEFLRQQLMSKVSSSTLKTDASPASSLGELSDLSAIQAANSSADKDRQRTSTPMTSSKSASKSKMMFSADSDLSSVRNEASYHSMGK